MKMNRRKFLKSFGALTAASFAGGSGLSFLGYRYGRQIEPERLVLEQVQIPLKNLGSALEGFKIVQLSDIHLHPYTRIELVQRAVSMVNALQPDLVVLTGDYVLREVEAIFELAPVLASINARYGIFTIFGNHDLWTSRSVVQQGFEEVGLSILHNEGLLLDIGREQLYLAGVDDGWSGKPDLKAALSNLPENVPTILLAHEPDLADGFSLDGRVSLQLSGHTHGGQVRLPGIGAPILPTLGKKYDQGLYQVNDMWLYTNRGIGLTVPIRINCPPEVTEITLIGA